MVGKDLIMATLLGSGGGSSGSGGGGEITVQTGSVTFADLTGNYSFVDGAPDIFVFYVADGNMEYSGAQYIWAQIQRKGGACYTFGYNSGSQKYFAPHKGVTYLNSMGKHNVGVFNGYLGVKTYNWIAIWGVS